MTADEPPATEDHQFTDTHCYSLINALTVVDLRLQALARTATQFQRDLIDDSRRSIHEACEVVQELARTRSHPA